MAINNNNNNFAPFQHTLKMFISVMYTQTYDLKKSLKNTMSPDRLPWKEVGKKAFPYATEFKRTIKLGS